MTPMNINPLTEEEIKKWPTKPLVDLEKASKFKADKFAKHKPAPAKRKS